MAAFARKKEENSGGSCGKSLHTGNGWYTMEIVTLDMLLVSSILEGICMKRSIRFLLIMAILVSLCVCVVPGAMATQGSLLTDDGKWQCESYNGGVALTAYLGSEMDIYAPGKVTINGADYTVVKLGDGIFKNNDAVNSVTLAESIVEIGDRAFYDADNLVCIVTSENLQTIGAEVFYSCNNMNSIILYDGVTAIGNNAFADCGKLTIWCNEGTAGYRYAVANGVDYEILNPNATPETVVLDGITYYIMNGAAYAVDSVTGLTDVTIPAAVEGYPVVELRSTFRNKGILKNVILPNSLRRIGQETFYYCDKLTSIVIPDSVTELGERAFQYCKSLQKVKLSQNLTRIEKYAFYSCSKLMEIEIPQSVTEISSEAFRFCGFTKIVIPQNVKEIGSYAFSGCYSLGEVQLSNGLTTLGGHAFYLCRQLTEVQIPDSVESLGRYAFRDCYNLKSATIGAGVKRIDSYTFYDCSSLENVTLAEGLEAIGDNAFYGCHSLHKVLIPQSVTSISGDAFLENVIWLVYADSYAYTYAQENNRLHFVFDGTAEPEFHTVNGVLYCVMNGKTYGIGSEKGITSVVIPAMVDGCPVVELSGTFDIGGSLQSVVLPNSLRRIGQRTFSGCNDLTTIEIPDSVTEIGEDAFSCCSSLQEVRLSQNLAIIANTAFVACDNLKEIELPQSLTEIGDRAFAQSGLIKITIPQGVKVIGDSVFSMCYDLTEVLLSDGLTTIGDSAFYDCTQLTEVRIPNSVKSLGSTAFVGCSELKSVTVGAGIKWINSNTFYGCSNLENVILTEGLEGISSGAFYGCVSLYKVLIPQSVTSISSDAFPENVVWLVYADSYAHTYAQENDIMYLVYDGATEPEYHTVDGVLYCVINGEAYAISSEERVTNVIIPATVEGYPVVELRGTFKNCNTLQSITLPDSLRRIGDETFYYCMNLKGITIPDSVTEIGESAFYACRRLKEVQLPKSITRIADYAFYGCASVKEIEIPQGVTEIGEYAFGESGLTKIATPQSMKTIGDNAFGGCCYLTEVQFLEGLTTIGNAAFWGCTELTEVRIPDSVVSLGNKAFQTCYGLKSVMVGAGVKQIEGAFFLCHRLTDVILPEGLLGIDNEAFYGCTSLNKVLIPQSVTSISSDAFLENTVLIVQDSSYAHTFAQENDLLYFVLHKGDNPEIYFGASITGTATYSDGSAVSGGTVEILYNDGTLKESVAADSSGNYVFTYAEVGNYIIRATDASGNTASTRVSVKRMNAFNVFVSGDMNLTLKKGYCVSGSVNAANAQVTITDRSGNVIATTVTDQNGAFAIQNVANGTYIIAGESSTGRASQEITVFNSDRSGIYLEIQAQAATIWGYTTVAQRDGTRENRNWVQVTIYNRSGIAVAQCHSDANGKYAVGKLPVGTYSIVAQTSEMRPDKKQGFDRSYNLTGYGYVVVTSAEEYQVDIVLYEENDSLVTISGKVTAHGQKQSGTVLLRDVFQNEIASYTTKSNGKYAFCNVRDGLYFITAITESEGMGYAVVVVRGGRVHGEADITVEKHSKILAREQKFSEEVPDLMDATEAEQYRSRIADEKAFYDSLSEKEKQQLSVLYVSRLNQYVEWLASVEYTATEGVAVEQGGLVVSGEELENNSQVTYFIDVQKTDGYAVSADGIQNGEDYLHYSMEDAANEHTIQQHYEITMYKSVDGQLQAITDVQKNTDTTGKFRITLEIPEEYRGYKHFSILHEHNGEIVQLTDLDNDPNTITVEVDAFSDFVLTATNIPLIMEMLMKTADINGDECLNSEDAVYLLLHTLFGDGNYPLYNIDADMDGNGKVDTYDAIYLLLHIMFGAENYPLFE